MGRLPFWSSSILVVFHFGRLQFWSSSISQVSLFLHFPFSIIFLHLFLCSSLHISPNLHLPLFSQCVKFSFFSFDWLTGSSFFCSLFIICIGISSGISISPGDGFSDSFVFLSFIFAVSSFFVFSSH